jgi:hypothetical protein
LITKGKLKNRTSPVRVSCSARSLVSKIVGVSLSSGHDALAVRIELGRINRAAMLCCVGPVIAKAQLV